MRPSRGTEYVPRCRRWTELYIRDGVFVLTLSRDTFDPVSLDLDVANVSELNSLLASERLVHTSHASFFPTDPTFSELHTWYSSTHSHVGYRRVVIQVETCHWNSGTACSCQTVLQTLLPRGSRHYSSNCTTQHMEAIRNSYRAYSSSLARPINSASNIQSPNPPLMSGRRTDILRTSDNTYVSYHQLGACGRPVVAA